LASFRLRSRRQRSVLRLPPEREGAAGGLLAGSRDRRLADASVLVFVDPNKPIPNERTQVARQRRPLQAEEVDVDALRHPLAWSSLPGSGVRIENSRMSSGSSRWMIWMRLTSDSCHRWAGSRLTRRSA
jgi:hypothetical protein